MDGYRELAERLGRLGQGMCPIMQGVVERVDGHLVAVRMGSLVVPDVRLRASAVGVDGELLLTPEVGSAVVVGSLSGDLAELVVLAVDRVASVVVTGSVSITGPTHIQGDTFIRGQITLNEGKNGGIVMVRELTQALNQMVTLFNSHVHPAPNTPPSSPLAPFSASLYENTSVTH